MATVLKKMEQKNVTLNKYYYTELELENMVNSGEVWYLKEEDERIHEYDFCGHSWKEYRNGNPRRELRVDLAKGDHLNVVPKDGFYTNELIKFYCDGSCKQYFVEL